MARTQYKYSQAQEIAWLLANQRLFRGRAAKTLEALRKHPASHVAQPVRVMHPDGRTGTIPARQLNQALASGYKQIDAAEHREYRGRTYRLRPGTDRRQSSNWDIVR